MLSVEDLAGNSVTVSEIQDGDITQAKLASGLSLGGGSYMGENGAVNTSGKGDIFRVHEQQLDTDTTIASTDNALAAGPLKISTSTTLTVIGNLTIV